MIMLVSRKKIKLRCHPELVSGSDTIVLDPETSSG